MSRYPRLLLAFIALVFSSLLYGANSGPVSVKGYTRKDGTYVAPHVRSAPNSTKSDNYSTAGNINPYTGKAGTKPGDSAPTVSSLTESGRETPSAAPSATTMATLPAVAQTAPTMPTGTDISAAIYAKLVSLEARLAAIEAKQSSDIAALRKEVQAALDVVGAEFGKLQTNPVATISPSKGIATNVAPSQTKTSDPAVDREAGPPKIEQWWRIKGGQPMSEVLRILGKPKSVSGHRWSYNGGGWIEFYDGAVLSFGGFEAK
jgi:hypothetical protein